MTMLRARIRAQNKNAVQQGGSLWAWLLVVLYITIFLVKGTVPAKKKPICAKMKINTSADFELCLFTEVEEEEDVGEIRFQQNDAYHCSDVFYHL